MRNIPDFEDEVNPDPAEEEYAAFGPPCWYGCVKGDAPEYGENWTDEEMESVNSVAPF